MDFLTMSQILLQFHHILRSSSGMPCFSISRAVSVYPVFDSRRTRAGEVAGGVGREAQGLRMSWKLKVSSSLPVWVFMLSDGAARSALFECVLRW